MKFKCKNTKCIEVLKNDPLEDNRLVVVIEDGTRCQYYINPDGTLEHYDSDGTGQEIYLECKLCGTKYEFDNCMLHIEEVPQLAIHIDNHLQTRKADLDDLTFKKEEERIK